jgi:outer membrane protein OmpA-like peptidoglycan-associated protein
VIKEGDHYKIRVPDILFPSNSADLNSVEAKQFLEANRGTLTKLAGLFSRFPDYAMVVEGHANSVYWSDKAAFAQEQEKILIPLSASRAITVANALMSLGVSPSRIRTRALGGSRPAYDFDSPDASKNRRVEFILVRK